MSRRARARYESLARAVLPWLIPLLTVLLMVTLFPPITMFLPTLFMGKGGAGQAAHRIRSPNTEGDAEIRWPAGIVAAMTAPTASSGQTP
jgi:hypothetical protein